MPQKKSESRPADLGSNPWRDAFCRNARVAATLVVVHGSVVQIPLALFRRSLQAPLPDAPQTSRGAFQRFTLNWYDERR